MVDIHLDAVGGIAGDMFVAACLDAFPHLEVGLRSQLAAALPADAKITLEPAIGDLAGRRFCVTVSEPAHHSLSYPEVSKKLEAGGLAPSHLANAQRLLEIIAEAEAAVHGINIERVHFHELAGWDSVADVIAATWLIEAIGVRSTSVSTLPMGRGLVRCAHGLLPVPAPAVARLLLGYELVDDGLDGERVTPTGAAILRLLGARSGGAGRIGRLVAIGNGFGTRKLAGRPNMLRLLAFELGSHAEPNEVVLVVTANIDDQSPEDLAEGLDRIRQVVGVHDIIQGAVLGKKGRYTVQVQVMAELSARQRVVDALFTETSTIGLRVQEVERVVLPRENADVRLDGVTIGVKSSLLPGGRIRRKGEMDDIAAQGEGYDGRENLRLRLHAMGHKGELGDR